MDSINPPIMENPVESITPIQPPQKKQPPVLTIILCFILIVTLLFLYLLFFTEALDNVKIFNPQDENSQQDGEDNQEEDETPEFIAYEGETFTAQLPTQWSISDWSIEEYYDGDGTDMLTDEEFTGLTGFLNSKKIFNPVNLVNPVHFILLVILRGIRRCRIRFPATRAIGGRGWPGA